MTVPSDAALRRLGLAMFGAQVALNLAYYFLSRGVSDQPALTYETQTDASKIVLGLAPGLVGLFLVWARPRNPIGWLIGVAGLSLMLSNAGQMYGARAFAMPEEGLPLGTLALSLSAPLWVPPVYFLVTHLLVRYPSGSVSGRWPRRFDRAVLVAYPFLFVGYATSDSSVTDVVRDEHPPVRLPELLAGGMAGAAAVVILVCGVAIIADAVRRIWTSTGSERWALVWLMAATVFAVLVIMVGPDEALGDLAYAGVLVTVATGVLRYGALGIHVTVLTGDRNDPFTALNRLGSSIGQDMDERSLGDVLDAVREALDVDGIAIDGPVQALSGTLHESPREWPLEFAGAELGVLLVGGRPGRAGLGRAGERLVEAVVPLIAAVLHAVQVAEELRVQQERVVAATQAERVRLRQELHDGLGPALTGIGLGLEALTPRVPTMDVELVTRLRAEVAGSLEETRRIIDDLRPSALDDGDLGAALRRRAEQLRASGLVVDVDIPAELPVLPAAVAVAVFRIAEEAMTNVVRHSGAGRARLAVSCEGNQIVLKVEDDGVGPGAGRAGGVGVVSMQDRAERLGGRFEIVATDPGTRVRVHLPWEVAP